VNVQQHMTLPVMLPGPYLEEAVQGMSQTVAEFSRVLDEVEQVCWQYVDFLCDNAQNSTSTS
jgi:hypothetical protein